MNAIFLIVVICISFLAKAEETDEFKRKAAVDAVGLSGSGFLGIYHVGVLHGLQLSKVMRTTKNVKVAGLSGGGQVAAFSCSGAKIATILSVFSANIEFCAADTPYYCAGKVDALLKESFDLIVPKDGWQKCNGNLYLEITDPKNDTLQTPPCTCLGGKNIGLMQYQSRDDLMQAMRATSFVSQWSTPGCYINFRGQGTCDGGYSVPSSFVPCPPHSKHCLKVTARTKEGWGVGVVADIYPGMRGVDTLPIPAAVWNAGVFNPIIANSSRDAMFMLGQLDAKFWANKNGY
jgi:hypothetical protein